MLFFGLAVEEHIPFLPPGQIIAFPPSVLSHIIIRFQSFLARCPNGSFSARKNTHFSLCKKSSLPLFQKLKRKKNGRSSRGSSPKLARRSFSAVSRSRSSASSRRFSALYVRSSLSFWGEDLAPGPIQPEDIVFDLSGCFGCVFEWGWGKGREDANY